jgi:predicted GIY-YIG superfamily endonuclease
MRDAYKYHLKSGRRVIHRGITNNLSRREKEHQTKYPGSKIKQVGRRTTRKAALEWERNKGKG